MRASATIAVVIPAFNEERAIASVLAEVPSWVDDVVVVDNASTDRTAEIAHSHGARVVSESHRGYGSACLTGIAALRSPDIVVFLDGDHSDYPEDMAHLVDPIIEGGVQMVIGSRVRGDRERGALTLQARWGNWLACRLIRLFWGVRYTDLGPFRAIRFSALKRLNMADRDYGWTVEMQIKAALHGLEGCEVPVRYRRRIGTSKISGTVRGVIAAGTKILCTLFRAALSRSYLMSPKESDECVTVFTRYPEPGTTKTRLIPALGEHGAAELQRRMTRRILGRAQELAHSRAVSLEVRFEGGDAERMRACFGGALTYCPQGEGDLGQRMLRAFEERFRAGARRMVIVGSDCPEVTAELPGRALDALKGNSVVLGPATDGGYYLVGLSCRAPELFEGVSWGTSGVLDHTLKIAEKSGLSVALLEVLGDVDRPEDMNRWHEAFESGDDALPERISVIIPALNEEATIGCAISGALLGRNVEVIVVDGGSSDSTKAVATACGARALDASSSRALQMNAGAATAEGEILLFLHADTQLPDGFDGLVRHALNEPGVVGGAFLFRTDYRTSVMRLIERLANWRSRCLQMPYGDQAIFVKRTLFNTVKGFRDLPIMEDFEFVRRLRRHGRIALAPAAAITSGRRWRLRGILATTLLNQFLIVAYKLGVSPARLALWYGHNSG